MWSQNGHVSNNVLKIYLRNAATCIGRSFLKLLSIISAKVTLFSIMIVKGGARTVGHNGVRVEAPWMTKNVEIGALHQRGN